MYNGYMYYCYVIENEKGELYYGSTDDLKRRLSEQQAGKSFATKGHDWLLIYYEAYRNKDDARRREQSIKRYGGTKKHLKDRIQQSRRLH
jgi:predicted GIY-YIG superfamily endonuclease